MSEANERLMRLRFFQANSEEKICSRMMPEGDKRPNERSEWTSYGNLQPIPLHQLLYETNILLFQTRA